MKSNMSIVERNKAYVEASRKNAAAKIAANKLKKTAAGAASKATNVGTMIPPPKNPMTGSLAMQLRNSPASFKRVTPGLGSKLTKLGYNIFKVTAVGVAGITFQATLNIILANKALNEALDRQKEIFNQESDIIIASSNADQILAPLYNTTSSVTNPSTVGEIFSNEDSGTSAPMAENEPTGAPSDPVNIDMADENLNNVLQTGQRDNIGFVSGDQSFGVEDANAFGASDLDLDNLRLSHIQSEGESTALDIYDPEVAAQKQAQQNNGYTPNTSSNRDNNPISFSNNYESGSGVSSNQNPSRVLHENQKFDSIKHEFEKELESVNRTYREIKSIENELMILDNIVHVRDTIITAVELQNKIESRLKRAQAIQQEIKDVAMRTTDRNDIFYFPLIAYDSTIINFKRLLRLLYNNPSRRGVLDVIEAVITPSFQRTSNVIEGIKTEYELASKLFLDGYEMLVEQYQDADESERNLSKIIKFEVDDPFISKSENTRLGRHMKQKFNHSSTRSLQTQRKMRDLLNTKTLDSKLQADKTQGEEKIKYIITEGIATTNINTDNILQKYPKAPFGVKTPSRRLNLLETPLALKTAPSVPYVNEYERTKRLFS